jgi:protein-tyrosine-phosphatase
LLAQLREASAALADLIAIMDDSDAAALRQFLAEAKALRDTVKPL